jgi:hypothetical protein
VRIVVSSFPGAAYYVHIHTKITARGKKLRNTMIANSTLAASCAALSSAIIQVFILSEEEEVNDHG